MVQVDTQEGQRIGLTRKVRGSCKGLSGRTPAEVDPLPTIVSELSNRSTAIYTSFPPCLHATTPSNKSLAFSNASLTSNRPPPFLTCPSPFSLSPSSQCTYMYDNKPFLHHPRTNANLVNSLTINRLYIVSGHRFGQFPLTRLFADNHSV